MSTSTSSTGNFDDVENAFGLLDTHVMRERANSRARGRRPISRPNLQNMPKSEAYVEDIWYFEPVTGSENDSEEEAEEEEKEKHPVSPRERRMLPGMAGMAIPGLGVNVADLRGSLRGSLQGSPNKSGNTAAMKAPAKEALKPKFSKQFPSPRAKESSPEMKNPEDEEDKHLPVFGSPSQIKKQHARKTEHQLTCSKGRTARSATSSPVLEQGPDSSSPFLCGAGSLGDTLGGGLIHKRGISSSVSEITISSSGSPSPSTPTEPKWKTELRLRQQQAQANKLKTTGSTGDVTPDSAGRPAWMRKQSQSSLGDSPAQPEWLKKHSPSKSPGSTTRKSSVSDKLSSEENIAGGGQKLAGSSPSRKKFFNNSSSSTSDESCLTEFQKIALKKQKNNQAKIFTK